MHRMIMSGRLFLPLLAIALVLMSGLPASAQEKTAQNQTALITVGESLVSPKIQLALQGPMQERINAVADQWLAQAPRSNPGLIEMFRLRDRNPGYDNPVIWAGEFAGKYLISAIQFLRMTDDAALRQQVSGLITDLISTQAADGYLGAFKKNERLLGNWDLWNHYHVMLALRMWWEDTGNTAALESSKRAADLICNTYLDSGRRVIDAGSPETNMAIMTELAALYRVTGNDRYLRLVRQIEQEWQLPGAGDYLRLAIRGVDFYKTPRSRWESLHDLQALKEIYHITGEEQYRAALLHYWHSIMRTDVHNCGSFSNGEGSIGNPFRPGAIETCCTVAWIALSVDALALAKDSQIADALERATWNTVLGYEHPSGRWCTYSTPMDGKRQASAHEIVFQSRAGTPELNCCSVNGPRGLGMISEWGVMTEASGLYLNYYGPGTMTFADAQGKQWKLTQQTTYPTAGMIKILIEREGTAATTLNLRIPGWSVTTMVKVNGSAVSGVTAGRYLAINRAWATGDTIDLTFDMSIKLMRGDEYIGYKSSIYRGPLLLAYDQKYNGFEPDAIPMLDATSLNATPVVATGMFAPIGLYSFKTPDGKTVNLCDYASAGAYGTAYNSWLPVSNTGPGAFLLNQPQNLQHLPAQAVALTWGASSSDASYRLVVARDKALTDIVFQQDQLTANQFTVQQQLDPDRTYYWQVFAKNSRGTLASQNGPYSFFIDPAIVVREDGLLLAADLDGSGKPFFGLLDLETSTGPAADRDGNAGKALNFNGIARLLYTVRAFPTRAYTFTAWVKIANQTNPDKLYQIACAWDRAYDDPLRLVVQNHQLKAIIESGSPYGTEGFALNENQWYHVATVKDGAQLRLYINGQLKQTAAVPETFSTSAETLGIGCNPKFGGDENFSGVIDEICLFDRALTMAQIQNLMQNGASAADTLASLMYK